MSLNKNCVSCVMPRSSKPPDTCKWGGTKWQGILQLLPFQYIWNRIKTNNTNRNIKKWRFILNNQKEVINLMFRAPWFFKLHRFPIYHTGKARRELTSRGWLIIGCIFLSTVRWAGGGGFYAAIYGMCFSSLALLCPKEFNVWGHERKKWKGRVQTCRKTL